MVAGDEASLLWPALMFSIPLEVPQAGFIVALGIWGELPPGKSIARTSIPSVNHGPQIPTAEKGLGTNMGMLALWGSGIRKGYRRPVETVGPAHVSDPAPTLAHILGCDPPRQSEGSVLRDMLE